MSNPSGNAIPADLQKTMLIAAVPVMVSSLILIRLVEKMKPARKGLLIVIAVIAAFSGIVMRGIIPMLLLNHYGMSGYGLLIYAIVTLVVNHILNKIHENVSDRVRTANPEKSG